MATQTPNLNLDLREASDIFNPLSTNSNFETLDSVITEIRKKGGVPTYTTTASANLLKLSENPVPNETLFKFVAAGDANTWSYQETVHNIVALDGKQKTVKSGEMYVAWVNAANAMVVIAWPDVVNAQTFDGKGPAEWATKAQLDAVNQAAANATQTAQAAATVANNALEAAQAAGLKTTRAWTNPNYPSASSDSFGAQTVDLANIPDNCNYMIITCLAAFRSIHPRALVSFTVPTSISVYDGGNVLYMQTCDASGCFSRIAEIGGNTVQKTRFIDFKTGYFAGYSNGMNTANDQVLIPLTVDYIH